jgi:hypothetical protein
MNPESNYTNLDVMKRLKPNSYNHQIKPSMDIKLKPPMESDAVFYSSATRSKDGNFLATQQDSVISEPDLLGRECLSFELVEQDIT